MELKKFIDDEFNDLIEKYSEINKTNIEDDLIHNTDILVKIVNKIKIIARELRAVDILYGEKYKEKYAYYGHESDLVPDNDLERKSMVCADADIIQLQKLKDVYMVDLEWLLELKEIFKKKSWDVSNVIKYREFESGK